MAFWRASAEAVNGDALRELAAQYLALAEKQGTAVPLMIGHRVMAVSLLFTGDLAKSPIHFDQAIALYDPVEHRPLAAGLGHDPRAAALVFRSLALWMLGYPAKAVADSDRALSDARETGQVAALMYVLGFISPLNPLIGNYAAAAAQGH